MAKVKKERKREDKKMKERRMNEGIVYSGFVPILVRNLGTLSTMRSVIVI